MSIYCLVLIHVGLRVSCVHVGRVNNYNIKGEPLCVYIALF